MQFEFNFRKKNARDNLNFKISFTNQPNIFIDARKKNDS